MTVYQRACNLPSLKTFSIFTGHMCWLFVIWDMSCLHLCWLARLIFCCTSHGYPSFGRCFLFSSAQTQYPLTGILYFPFNPPPSFPNISAAIDSYYFPRVIKYSPDIIFIFHISLLEYSHHSPFVFDIWQDIMFWLPITLYLLSVIVFSLYFVYPYSLKFFLVCKKFYLSHVLFFSILF